MRATSETLARARAMLQQAVPTHRDHRRRRSTGAMTSAREIVIALLPGLPLGSAALASLKQDGLWWRDTHETTSITSPPLPMVAKDLGEDDEDWLHDVANEMKVEDGAIWVYGAGEDGLQAFTDFVIDRLIEPIQMYRENPELLKRWPPEYPTDPRPTLDAYPESHVMIRIRDCDRGDHSGFAVSSNSQPTV